MPKKKNVATTPSPVAEETLALSTSSSVGVPKDWLATEGTGLFEAFTPQCDIIPVHIDISSYCDHSEREEEQYGHWEERYSHSLNGARLCSPSETTLSTEPVLVPKGMVLKAGDPIYVLLAVYSTGDSFGHSEGNTRIIATYASEHMARMAYAKFKANMELKHYLADEPYSVAHYKEDGMPAFLENPGEGYFESLDSFEINTLNLDPAPTPIQTSSGSHADDVLTTTRSRRKTKIK